MTERLCRVSVHVDEQDRGTVDLTLPRTTYVGMLLPAIIDIVHGGTDTLTDVRRWRLSRLGGHHLNEWMTLDDNDVHDGEMLLLTTIDTPEPEWRVDDPCHTVAIVADGGHESAVRITVIAAYLCTVVICATALAWTGVRTHATGHLITSVILAVVATAGAVAIQRVSIERSPRAALAITAVVFAATAGFLAVPSGPSPGGFLLATAAGCPVSILLLRLSRCGTTCLTAIATFTATVVVALAAGVVWTLPVDAVGAVLVTVALAILSAAARLTIAAAGLAPSIPPADDHTIDTVRAVLGHRYLTGMVVGTSAGAALGALLAAYVGRSWRGVVFSAVVGLVLLLRNRTHTDITRRIALVAAGVLALAASFAAAAACAPGEANWASLIATGAGLAAVGWVFGGVTINPVIRRAIDATECLAVAAVVPLTCWVLDLYGLVRTASLT